MLVRPVRAHMPGHARTRMTHNWQVTYYFMKKISVLILSSFSTLDKTVCVLIAQVPHNRHKVHIKMNPYKA